MESYEKAFEKLEKIISDLEDNSLSLEDSIKKYEEGIKLYNYCKEILNEYEGKVKILVEEENRIIQKDFIEGENNGEL